MNAIKCFIILLLTTIIGCKDETTVEEAYLNFSTEYLSFDSKGGEKQVDVYSNSDWKIASEIPEWISVNKIDSDADKSILTFELTENTSDKSRACQLYFEYPSGGNVINITQSGDEFLQFSDKENIYLNENDTVIALNILKNVPYIVDINSDADWIDIDGYSQSSESQMAKEFTDKQIVLNISGNRTGNVRNAHIVIFNKKFNLSDTININQISGEKLYYTDGEYFVIQKAKINNPVNLFIMGDGFTVDDMNIGGIYEETMKQSMEYFFSIEPYASYRDYFTVYSVVAESETDVVGGGKTKFQTRFGTGTAISCNDDMVFKYVKNVKDIDEDEPVTVIVPLNIDKYAGTAYMYGNGNSIALCPMSTELPPYDFEDIIHHEAGGHAFGLLCDEYVYYDKVMPESRIKEIKEWQEMGFYHNLDFTDNLEIIRWKDFVGHAKYSDVGAFEGGYEYQYGVWRSEENSCMNNNIPYFNVQSRWSIVKRIMTISGTDFSISDFMENDIINKPYESRGGNVSGHFIPLGEPVMIKDMK